MTRRALLALPILAAIAAPAVADAPVTVTKAEFRRAPAADRSAALLVRATDAGGRILSLDVRWGDGQRDHLTLAPAYRRATVTRRFTHVYRRRGTFTVTVRARSVEREDSAPRRLRVRVR